MNLEQRAVILRVLACLATLERDDLIFGVLAGEARAAIRAALDEVLTFAAPTPEEQPSRWLRFDEGWGVPDPSDDFIGDAIWRIVYSAPTRVDVRHVVSLAQAFIHLAMHPSGVEACVKQLREIRRRIRENERGALE